MFIWGVYLFKKGYLKVIVGLGLRVIWHGLFSLILVCDNRGNLVFDTRLYFQVAFSADGQRKTQPVMITGCVGFSKD